MDRINKYSLVFHMRKIGRLFLLSQSLFFGLSGVCQAGQLLQIDWIAIEAGMVSALGSHNTTSEAMPTGYAPVPYYYDDYVTNQRGNSALLGIGFGKQFERSKLSWLKDGWFLTQRLGLFWEQTSAARVSGEILQYQQSPATYQYQ